MNTKIVTIRLTIGMILLTKSIYAQNIWNEGINNTKSGQFVCKVYNSTNTITVKKTVNDERVNYTLKMEEGESVKAFINSEKDFSSILKSVFDHTRIKELVLSDEKFEIIFTLDSDGNPIQTTFRLNLKTTLTPYELNEIDEQIKSKIKFKIKRDFPRKDDHINMYFQRIKFVELLSGEIKSLKENETEGKKYW